MNTKTAAYLGFLLLVLAFLPAWLPSSVHAAFVFALQPDGRNADVTGSRIPAAVAPISAPVNNTGDAGVLDPDQPTYDFDFGSLLYAPPTGNDQQTTLAVDSVNGNDANAGTLYEPKLSLPQTLASGDVLGLYRGSSFRASLSLGGEATSHGIVVQDLTLGSTKTLPRFSALDPVPNDSFTSNGDGTYSALWTATNNPLDATDQGRPFVVEINTTDEITTPMAARHSLAVLTNQGAVASTVGSCFVLPPGTGSGQSGSTTQYKAIIHPSGTLANYRYEVTARSWAANWDAGGYGGGDGAMSGVSVFNGSHGYGLDGPQSFVADTLVLSHASLHHAVFGSGSLQRSVFYEMGVDNLDNSGGNTAIQFVWYTNDGTGLSFDTRRCVFYAVNGNYPASFLAHTGGNNYARGDLSDCAFVGGRIADGSLRGAAIQYNNVASGTINRVFVQGYADALLLNVQPIEVENCVFRQIHEVQVTSNFHDNIFAEESASIPGSYNNYPLALFMAANGASATNNIAWAHGLPTGVTFDLYSSGISFAPNVTAATIQRNVIILDPDPSSPTAGTYAYFPSGASATAGFSMDYNLVISTAKGGFATNGGAGNTDSWTAYQAAYPALDAHSMFVDLSGDPRGLKAVFADPANGDFRWADTEVGAQCEAFCEANNVGPATVTTHWPTVPTVDEAVAAISLPPPKITSPGAVTFTTGAFSAYTIATDLDATPGTPSGYSATSQPAWLSLNTTSGVMSGTPPQAGNFTLSVNATNPAGTGSAELAITVQTAYMAWQNTYFTAAELNDPAISGLNACPAGDGIPNLIKYALGLKPKIDGTSGLPVVSSVPTAEQTYLALTYTKALSATDLTYTVEASGDLSAWCSGSGSTAEISATNNPDGQTQTVVVRDLVPEGTAAKRFLRLKITLP